MKKKLIQRLFVHLDLIAAKEPSRLVLKELFENIADLLFRPPLETRERTGEFCSRISRARFFVAKNMLNVKRSEHKTAGLLTVPTQNEGPVFSIPNALRRAISPAPKQPLDLCVGSEFLAFRKRERLEVDHSTKGLNLKIPPETLSELLVRIVLCLVLCDSFNAHLVAAAAGCAAFSSQQFFEVYHCVRSFDVG